MAVFVPIYMSNISLRLSAGLQKKAKAMLCAGVAAESGKAGSYLRAPQTLP